MAGFQRTHSLRLFSLSPAELFQRVDARGEEPHFIRAAMEDNVSWVTLADDGWRALTQLSISTSASTWQSKLFKVKTGCS